MVYHVTPFVSFTNLNQLPHHLSPDIKREGGKNSDGGVRQCVGFIVDDELEISLNKEDVSVCMCVYKTVYIINIVFNYVFIYQWLNPSIYDIDRVRFRPAT